LPHTAPCVDLLEELRSPEQLVADEHSGFFTSPSRTLPHDLTHVGQSGFKVSGVFRVVAVLPAPALIGVIDVGGAFLTVSILDQALFDEESNLVVFSVVGDGCILDRLRHIQTASTKLRIALQRPVEDVAEVFLPKELILQTEVPLELLEVPLKGNDLHTSAGQQGQVGHRRQVVSIGKNFELGFEVKAVLVQESGIDCVAACQRLKERRAERQALVRLADVHKPCSGQPRHILKRSGAAVIGFYSDGFRPAGSSIIPQILKNVSIEVPLPSRVVASNRMNIASKRVSPVRA